MKPGFALDLTHEGIALMHRGKGGWALVGEVKLDDPDLLAQLALMRQRAIDVDRGGFSTKLLLPPSQLLFTTMTAPGPDDASRAAQIREGLEGLTPYAVDELVFDWHRDGDMAHVAVVARETLAEAEAFAVENRMNPVAFAARPHGSFEQEAFFGQTSCAAQYLRRGATVERERVAPPHLMGTDARVATRAQEEVLEVQAPKDPPAASEHPTPVPGPSKPSTETTPQPPAAPTKNRTAKTTPTQDTAPVLAPFPPDFEPAQDSPVSPKPAPTTEVPPSSSASASAPKVSDGKTRAKGHQAHEPAAPPSRGTETGKRPGDAPTDTSSGSDGTGAAPDVAASSPAAGVPPFATRRAPNADAAPEGDAAADNASAVAPKPTPSRITMTATGKPVSANNVTDASGTKGLAPSAPAVPPAPAVKTPQSVHVPVTAPTVDGGAQVAPSKSKKNPVAAAKETIKNKTSAAKKRGKAWRDNARKGVGSAVTTLAKHRNPAGGTDSTTKVQSSTPLSPPPAAFAKGNTSVTPRVSKEAEALTVFGARRSQDIGGKPRYLGLFMVLGLLLLMAVLAVWSMFFLSDQTANLFPDSEDQFESAITTGQPSGAAGRQISNLPGSDPVTLDEVMAEGQTAPGTPTEDEDPAEVEANEDLEGLSLSPELAETRYAATGVWERAPDPLRDPTTDKLDDIYVASIDPNTTIHDAVALPSSQIEALATPAGAASLRRPPPPKGTAFRFDANGLVRPTAEGSLTPDGYYVFAGRPDRVPANRPAGLFPDAEETTPEPAIATTPPGLIPRLRPEGLMEDYERSRLGGLSRQEVAAIRPRLRPDTIPQIIAAKQAAAASQADAINNVVADQAAAAAAAQVAAMAAPTRLAVANSATPRARPRGFERIVRNTRKITAESDGSVVVAAAPRAQTVTPKIPTRASVAKQATIKNAIPLRKVALIGIFGSSSKRRALVRLKSGRYVKVGIGDRIDGGRVISITQSKLVYKKGSRSTTLKVLPF